MHAIYPDLLKLLPRERPITVLEIGAHCGSDTARLMAIFPNARIICFEPDPRNVAEFRTQRLGARAKLIAAAVGDRDGPAELHLSSGVPDWVKSPQPGMTWTCSSSLKKPTDHLSVFPWCRFDQTQRVPMVRLDTVAGALGISAVDFIWADVQGAEDLMIAGAQRTLAQTRYLFTECSEHALYEGQPNLARIMESLPGHWTVVRRFENEVLLENASLGAAKPTNAVTASAA